MKVLLLITYVFPQLRCAASCKAIDSAAILTHYCFDSLDLIALFGFCQFRVKFANREGV